MEAKQILKRIGYDNNSITTTEKWIAKEVYKLATEDSVALRQQHVRCSVCGCFMRRLKLLEKIRLGLLPDTNHTYICKRESIDYETGVIEHE